MRNVMLILLIVTTGLTMGCSRFARRWRDAGGESPPVGQVTGRWEGTWQSDVNRHRGRLRCMISQSGPKLYEAWFQATFWKIVRSSYRVELEGMPQPDGSVVLSGTADLGSLGGGLFRCEGRADPVVFAARYQSQRDAGRFDMRRPGAERSVIGSGDEGGRTER